jgi:ubiquinone/menaquinone biosynthesis C-methylase UbiE
MWKDNLMSWTLDRKHWEREWGEPRTPKIPTNERVVKHILSVFNNKIKGRKFLEVGAGSGGDSIYLAMRGARTYCLDYTSSSLELIKEVSKKKHVAVEVVMADIRAIPFEDCSFDAVFSAGVMEHFQHNEILSVFNEQKRVLKDRGFLLVDVPQKYTLCFLQKKIAMFFQKWPVWETAYRIDRLKTLFMKSGFKIVVPYYEDFLPLHKIGAGTFGKAILPNKLGNIYKNLITKRVMNWEYAPYFCDNIGIIGQKIIL